MTYIQHIYNQAQLLSEERDALEKFSDALPDVQKILQGWYEDASLPLLQLPKQRERLQEIQTVVEAVTKRERLIVLGTGGSSLGGQTLCALSVSDFPVHFFDNVDPHTIDRFLAAHDMSKAHLLVVSKSGGTVETLSQAAVFISAMEAAVGKEGVALRCHAIAMPGDRPLRALAEQYGVSVLDHDPDVGGRYSVLSLVGLIPAAAAGLDVAAICAGAAGVMDDVLAHHESAPLLGAAWQTAVMKRRPVSVWMPYCDRLSLFGAWVQQLWAESLGKGGHGSTPARAVGAVDQHSQLQLYLDGPKDKSFNLMTLPYHGHGATISNHAVAALDYLDDKTMGDVMASLQYGTVETFKRHKLPLRIFELDVMDEKTLGALLMHVMIETIATAQLLGVDAFDQPAVEEGKQIAREYLRNYSVQGHVA